MSTSGPTSEDFVRPVPRNLGLWFGLLGAPIVWTLRFLALYGLTEAGCVAGLQQIAILGVDLITGVSLGITVIAIAVVVAAGLVAHHAWRDKRDRERTAGEERTGRTVYMGLMGVLLCGFFLPVIVVETVPFFVLDPCAVQ